MACDVDAREKGSGRAQEAHSPRHIERRARAVSPAEVWTRSGRPRAASHPNFASYFPSWARPTRVAARRPRLRHSSRSAGVTSRRSTCARTSCGRRSSELPPAPMMRPPRFAPSSTARCGARVSSSSRSSCSSSGRSSSVRRSCRGGTCTCLIVTPRSRQTHPSPSQSAYRRTARPGQPHPAPACTPSTPRPIPPPAGAPTPRSLRRARALPGVLADTVCARRARPPRARPPPPSPPRAERAGRRAHAPPPRGPPRAGELLLLVLNVLLRLWWHCCTPHRI